ncbi:MAG TPA: T9SS type A sorting domain-containing protein [Bacteroidales bacterium]|nr:T9SS type A sorting domain-containing protein [Bacteroidales bacterium]
MKTLLRVLFLLILPVFMFWSQPAAQTAEFWGILKMGGSYNIGAIFKTDGNGDKLKTVYEFKAENSGMYPTAGKLRETGNGKLYGLTILGGADEMGTLYEFDPELNTCKVLYDFNEYSGGFPVGSLVEAENGRFYGMTAFGGTMGSGTIFEYDPDKNSLSVKHVFDGDLNGYWPNSSLLLGTNGKCYGLTCYGGLYDLGIFFEYDYEENIFTKIIDFNGEETGEYPQNGLVWGINGMLYGSTCSGGLYNSGVLFEYDPVTNLFSKRFDFSNSTGSCPHEFVCADNGKLYGLLGYSQNSNGNELVSYDPFKDTLETEVIFNDDSQGGYANQSLLIADNGCIYGTTSWNGEYQSGTIFEYDPLSGLYSKVFDFPFDPNSSMAGALLQAHNGSFYGTFESGGDGGCGSIYKFELETGAFERIFDFNSAVIGKYPDGCLVDPGNGRFYGTSNSGGHRSGGNIFEFDPVTSEIVKTLNFGDFDAGRYPVFSLTRGNNGKLYGMTVSGGKYDQGTLFECDESLTYLKKITDFSDDISGLGVNPVGKLILASNQKLYGALGWGENGMGGCLFEFDPEKSTCKVIKQFSYQNVQEGFGPTGRLCEAKEGILYGTTNSGGSFDRGVIFEYDIENKKYSKIYNFSSYVSLGFPVSGLVKGQGSLLYGLCANGGFYNMGGLYEFDPDLKEITQDLDFGWIGGTGMPVGELMAASNGKIYGFTDYSRDSPNGVMFEYNPAFNILKKKADMPFPAYECSLIETGTATGLEIQNDLSLGRVFPNPNNGFFSLELDPKIHDFLVIIRNTGGQSVSEIHLRGSSAKLYIPGPEGMYFIEVRTDRSNEIFKVIKR